MEKTAASLPSLRKRALHPEWGCPAMNLSAPESARRRGRKRLRATADDVGERFRSMDEMPLRVAHTELAQLHERLLALHPLRHALDAAQGGYAHQRIYHDGGGGIVAEVAHEDAVELHHRHRPLSPLAATLYTRDE